MGAAWPRRAGLRRGILRHGLRRYRGLRALRRLAGELRSLQFQVTVQEGVGAVVVDHELVLHPLVCITIDPDTWVFTWRGGYHQHPASDPAGAARRVRAYINTRAGAGWGLS